MRLSSLLLKRLNATKEGRRDASEIDRSPAPNAGAESRVADLRQPDRNTGRHLTARNTYGFGREAFGTMEPESSTSLTFTA